LLATYKNAKLSRGFITGLLSRQETEAMAAMVLGQVAGILVSWQPLFWID
jgi:hypothetical protein